MAVSQNKGKTIFDGFYSITDNGNLYSIRNRKYIKPRMDRYGYLYYVISINNVRKTVKAHRLVAMAYIPNPLNKPTVNHKNGIRHDNRIDNPEWATSKEQSADPLTTIKRKKVVAVTDYYAMGALRNFGRKKTAVYKGKVLSGVYESLKDAVKNYPAAIGRASLCANGKIKSAGGVRFCYL